jgi:hypothetical protein
LIAQNEGSGADQTEKAFDFSAETKSSWCTFPMEAEATVGKSWLGLFGQVFRLDRWSVCRVQAAGICGSRVK